MQTVVVPKIVEIKNKPVKDFTDFDRVFPKLIESLELFGNNTQLKQDIAKASKYEIDALKNYIDEFYTKDMIEILDVVDNEIYKVLGQPWQNLKKQNQRRLTAHTFLVLQHAVKDPQYQTLIKKEQDIVKWACLLHNIGKLGKPTIFGRDYIYPFNSAAIALKILRELNILNLHQDPQKDTDFSEVLRLIDQSKKPVPTVMREDFTPGIPFCT